MKRLLLTLSLLVVGAVSALAQSPIVPSTQASVAVAGTVAARTTLITGVAGRSIYVTSIALVPVATSVVTLSAGTGTNCGTGTTTLTGAMTFAAGQVLAHGAGNGTQIVVPAGNDLCITIDTAAAPGVIAYAQF